MKKIDAVILANGDYPSAPMPLKVLHEAPYVVCCDGGANEYIAQGYLPDVIIGDGDSLSEENRIKYASLIQHNPDQETNDQTKAISYLASKGYTNIAIVAATGRREDHTLGNISLLMEYMRQGLQVRIYTDFGVFIPCRDNNTFESPVGSAVSIFSFGTAGMTAEGLQYPLRDFTSWWEGTLNVTTAPSFTIKCKGEYLVYITYPEK
jgi:thiamine pyrophosphokinase